MRLSVKAKRQVAWRVLALALNVALLIVGLEVGAMWAIVVGGICTGACVERILWLTSDPMDSSYGQLWLRQR